MAEVEWTVTWEELLSHVDRERRFLEIIEKMARDKKSTDKVPKDVTDGLKSIYFSTGPTILERVEHRAKWNCPPAP